MLYQKQESTPICAYTLSGVYKDYVFCENMDFMAIDYNLRAQENVASVKDCMDMCAEEFSGGYWNSTINVCFCKNGPAAGSEVYYPRRCQGSGFHTGCRTCRLSGLNYCDLTSVLTTSGTVKCDDPRCQLVCKEQGSGSYPNPWDITGGPSIP